MVKNGEILSKCLKYVADMVEKWWKYCEILFFLKIGEMVKNGDFNLKIVFHINTLLVL